MSSEHPIVKTGRYGRDLSPETVVRAKLTALWGGLVLIVSCTITCTIFVVKMDGKADRGLALSEEINKELKRMAPEHTILWEWYTRLAARSGSSTPASAP